jgi:hypothetical protein
LIICKSDVTNTDTTEGARATTEAVTGSKPEGEDKSKEEKVNRPKQALKPNVKLSGPEWLRG